MPEKVTTTGFIRDVIDITAKPKRFQSAVSTEEPEATTTKKMGIPRSLTAEQVAKYFEENYENVPANTQPLYEAVAYYVRGYIKLEAMRLKKAENKETIEDEAESSDPEEETE